MTSAAFKRAVTAVPGLVLTSVMALAAAAPAGAATPPDYPVPYTMAAGVLAEALHPNSAPPGSDIWSCKPSAAHPYPVILVHGLFADQTDNWQTMSPLLADAGYCVYSLTYGNNPSDPPPANDVGGLSSMTQSAAVLKRFVERVLRATGAPKVDIVGHSEGATMPDWYVKFMGGASVVANYVAISAVFHGTEFYGVATLEQVGAGFGVSSTLVSALDPYCTSCTQFLTGSSFIDKLNSGPTGAAVPGVIYTDIATENDELVQPYTSGFLSGPNVTNFTVQQQCPLDESDHVSMAADPVVAQDLLNALDPTRDMPVSCVPVVPGAG